MRNFGFYKYSFANANGSFQSRYIELKTLPNYLPITVNVLFALCYTIVSFVGVLHVCATVLATYVLPLMLLLIFTRQHDESNESDQ